MNNGYNFPLSLEYCQRVLDALNAGDIYFIEHDVLDGLAVIQEMYCRKKAMTELVRSIEDIWNKGNTTDAIPRPLSEENLRRLLSAKLGTEHCLKPQKRWIWQRF